LLGTHGRGFFFTDAVPIQEYQQLPPDESIHLYPVQKAWTGPGNWSPPRGEAHISYYVKEKCSVAVVIKDQTGIVIKEDIIQAEQGINTYIWRFDGISPEGKFRYFGAGKYTVVLEAYGKSTENILEVGSFKK
jgi:hypothetical protein